MIIDSTFVFWYGQLIHLHTVIDLFSPSWLKDSHAVYLQYSCQNRQLHVYDVVIFSVFFFLNLQLFYLSIITTIEHIKDYKYRALLSWSLGSFKYKLSERYPFCRLGFFMSIQLFLFAAVLTSSLPADVPRCCSHRQK